MVQTPVEVHTRQRNHPAAGSIPLIARRLQLMSSNLAGTPSKVSGARWMQGGTG